MRIDLAAFQEHYHEVKKGELVFKDNWQEGIKLLPFTSNTSSAIDKNGGLAGATGAFFRLIDKNEVQTIEKFEETESKVKEYLIEKRNMPEVQADEFVHMLRDIMLVNGSLNVTDVAFLKYIPLVPDDELISDKNKNKYKAGQKKLANLLASIIDANFQMPETESNNLFTKLLKEALVKNNSSGLNDKKKIEEEFYVLPYIVKSFNEDFNWLIKQDSSVVVRYVHLLLHFYVCYAVLQILPKLSYKERNTTEPVKLYYILKSEKASVTHDAVECWKKTFPKHYLDKIYGRSQALDILNCILGGKVGFYAEVMKLISETSFDENKLECEALLRSYQEEKRDLFSNRNSESESLEEIDVSVNSYEDFFCKLEDLCRKLQSHSYKSRMRKKIVDLLSMRFLQLRRGNYVLVIDNEMLVFLIGMMTKGRRTKLEDMYKRFNTYGIHFNRGSRMAIESYLLKLNLLDRKSDSGEAQYVKVIL